jgi:hypothetical protein
MGLCRIASLNEVYFRYAGCGRLFGRNRPGSRRSIPVGVTIVKP